MALPKLKIDRRRIERLSGRERELAEQRVRDLLEAVERNPLLRYNNPRLGPVHPKQIKFHEMLADGIKEVGYMGGNQSGKTTAGVEHVLIQALDDEMVPEHLKRFKTYQPPFRCRIGGQGREEIEDFIFEKIKDWVPMEALVGGSWKKAYDSLHHVLHFKNKSYIQFKTYQQEGKQWGGSTLDFVLLDEEPGAVHLKESRIRIMRREGQIALTMTPVEGLSHTFEIFEDAIEEAEVIDFDTDRPIGWSVVDDEIDLGNDQTVEIQRGLVFSDMDDNPWLTPAAKAIALQGLSEEERRARKEGKFVAMSGLIYKRFDRNKHVIEPIQVLPDNVNVFVSIDPGFRHPCAVGFYYVDTQGAVVKFEEIHVTETIIKDVCGMIKMVEAAYDFEPIYYVIDSAAANRNNQTGRSDQDEFADHGIVTIPAQKKVTAGINRVRTYLDEGKLHFTSNCENTLREFRQYRWKKPPKTESLGKEEPVKANDDSLDETRYAIMSRPYLPSEQVPDNETNLERIIREEIEQITQGPVPIG